jgi:hypothetical protein
LLVINWYGLAIKFTYPSGEEGGISLVRIMRQTICLDGAYRKGGGSTLYLPFPPFNFLFEGKTKVLLIDNLSYRQYKSVEFMFR